MWAPTDVNHFQVASHVFTVEFHTYLYHLFDLLPPYGMQVPLRFIYLLIIIINYCLVYFIF